MTNTEQSDRLHELYLSLEFKSYPRTAAQWLDYEEARARNCERLREIADIERAMLGQFQEVEK